jgi:glutamate N-acetyltransferase/amino-acid N-acetyltransferase
VKTAVHGGDPNWGRLVAVAGRATRTLVLDRARIRIGPVELFSNGAPFDERAPEARSTCGQGDRPARRSGHRRQRRSADVVVRSDRGIRQINAEYRT